jgi:putative chitinase
MTQCAHESGGFRYNREIWGPTPAQLKYEGRADLGNDQRGDGFRYLGRGPGQVTGRDNYRRFGRLLGIDLEAHPELVEIWSIGLLVFCAYWDAKNLNVYADADNLLGVSNGINRGNPASTASPNGWPDRQARYRVMRDLIL